MGVSENWSGVIVRGEAGSTYRDGVLWKQEKQLVDITFCLERKHSGNSSTDRGREDYTAKAQRQYSL